MTTENGGLNIYQKIQKVKLELSQKNLKKSGKNSYAGFDYYELSDIMPTIIELCDKYNLFTHITFTNEEATLTILNTENKDEYLHYTSPMRELELKGCNQIQCLGGIESYQRRYLFIAALDITESDMFDATAGKEDGSTVQKEASKTNTSNVEEKPWFNQENLDKFTSIAKQYKNADEALQEIKAFYRISRAMEEKVRKLYEDLKSING